MHVDARFGLSLGALAAALLPGAVLPVFLPVYTGFLALLPIGLALVAVVHSFRAWRLRDVTTGDADDASEKALHFSVFSLSFTGIFVVVLLLAVAFARE